MFEFVRKEETNVVIWVVRIIQCKAAMDGFEWLLAIERTDKDYFGTANDKKYDG